MGDTTGLSGDLLLGGAFVVTQIAALWLAERAGLDSRTAFRLTVLGAAGALLGGSLWTAASRSAGAGLLELLLTGERGVIGALAGAACAGLGWLVLTRRPVLAYLDAMIPAVFLGYAVARMACLVDGHCFGAVTDLPVGITYPRGTEAYAAQVVSGLIQPGADRSLPVHPTQLYHAAVGVLGFVFLVRMERVRAGTRTSLALLLYGGARFLIEIFRGDAPAPIDLNQTFCLAMIAGGIALWCMRPERTANPAFSVPGAEDALARRSP